MSKVYSFRLSEDNSREILAMKAIEDRISQGYSLRHILTKALIGYGDHQNGLNELEKHIDRYSELIRKLDINGVSNTRSDRDSGLSSSFIAALKRSAKQGIRSDHL